MALYDRIMDGVRMAEAGRAAGRRSKLESLLGDAYSNPQGRQQAFSEAARIDPMTTIAMQQKLGDIDQEGLTRAAQMLVAAPEDLRPQIYKSQVYQYGQGMGVPQEYTPFMLPMMEKLARRGEQDGTPAQQRHQEWLLSQLREEDRPQALKYFAGLGSRPLQESFSSEVVQTNDGPMVLQRGRLGETRLVPFQTGGGGSSMGAPAQRELSPESDFSALSTVFGVRPSSIRRTSERNREVGGVPNSYHLTGQAADFPVPEAMKAQFMAQARSMGYEAIDEGDHIHIEPPPSSGMQGQPGGGGARPLSSAEEAGQKRLAETNVDLATADARARAEAQIAGQREAAVQGARGEAKRAEQAPVRREAFRQMVAKTDAVGGAIDRALSQVDWSTSGPIGSFMSNLPGSDAYDLRATIDTIKANLAFDTLQQMRAASPTGGALGAVSERELRLLESAVASLDQAQSGAQLRQAMQTIKQHYQEWRRSAEAAFQQAQSGRQGSSQQPSGWGIQRVD